MDKRIPVPKPDFYLESLDNELLLYHPSQTRTLYLNETASLVWRLCDGKRTIDEIKKILMESYPDSTDNVASDVAATLDQFVTHGAIKIS